MAKFLLTAEELLADFNLVLAKDSSFKYLIKDFKQAIQDKKTVDIDKDFDMDWSIYKFKGAVVQQIMAEVNLELAHLQRRDETESARDQCET